ncbi:hypothetical protein ACWER6_22960 [Streptomyces sp. NPDC004009]
MIRRPGWQGDLRLLLPQAALCQCGAESVSVVATAVVATTVVATAVVAATVVATAVVAATVVAATVVATAVVAATVVATAVVATATVVAVVPDGKLRSVSRSGCDRGPSRADRGTAGHENACR